MGVAPCNRQNCQRWPAAQHHHEACVSVVDDMFILHKGETDFVPANLESGIYIPPPLLLLQGLWGSVGASSHAPRPFTALYWVLLACPGWAGQGKGLASLRFAFRTAALCLKMARGEHSRVLWDTAEFWGKPCCWRRQMDVEASLGRNVVQKNLLHPLPQIPNTAWKKKPVRSPVRNWKTELKEEYQLSLRSLQ